MIRYSKKLVIEYYNLFETAQVLPSRQKQVEDVIKRAVENKPRYDSVLSLGMFPRMPWFFIAAIHNLESGFDFNTHLHNGDPLTAKTVRVPSGRPRLGTPPFKWENSALDALLLKGFDKVRSWALPELLWRLECYNGLGYRLYHPNVLSPYLWSFTQHYKRGKYVSDEDGWDENFESDQVGAAALIRRMLETGVISSSEIDMSIPKQELPTIRYSEKEVIDYGDYVQNHLNQFPGIKLKVDKWPGPKTSAAFCSVYGRFLVGDPREKDQRQIDDQQHQAFPGLPVKFYSSECMSHYSTLVQSYLNRFPNTWVSVDGWLGNNSSDAFNEIHGMYLLGDPRSGNSVGV